MKKKEIAKFEDYVIFDYKVTIKPVCNDWSDNYDMWKHLIVIAKSEEDARSGIGFIFNYYTAADVAYRNRNSRGGWSTDDPNRHLSSRDLLFALRCVIDDMIYSLDFTKEQFLEELGYLESGKSALKGIKAYEQCTKQWNDSRSIYPEFSSLDYLHQIIDKLAEQGIE